ncbi:MAG: helix-turn-helix transcriptional regulator [Clostridia bacterium]|nr:helix-turn-helix transcriptional regulator [Clostridia bacterium]
MPDQAKIRILKRKAELLKTIAHPMRLCILSCLMGAEECNVKTLVQKMETPQSTISQHLSKLRSSGVIEGERHGVEIQYHIVNEEVIKLIRLLLDGLYEEAKEEIINC